MTINEICERNKREISDKLKIRYFDMNEEYLRTRDHLTQARNNEKFSDLNELLLLIRSREKVS